MAKTRRCSSPASNICPKAIRNTTFAGAIKGGPIEVMRRPVTGLPLPPTPRSSSKATAAVPETSLPEGPFGEFTGYYAADARPAR